MSLRNIYLTAIVVLALCNALIWYGVYWQNREAVLTVAFLDVGQGDAIYIKSPTGNEVLVDGGPDGAVLRELGAIMPLYDRSIDVVIATHSDKDHIAGLIDAFRAYEVGMFIDSGVEADTSYHDALEEAVWREGAASVVARRGMNIQLGGGAYLVVLFPDRDAPNIETNQGSIVAKLVYGTTSFMLMGDSPDAIEEYLVMLDGNTLDSDVLKVGHHGSRTSTQDSFLSLVTPSYAIISAGKDNSYGHPHTEVVEQLVRFGASILGTYEKGRIVIESDGKVLEIKK